MTHGLSRSAFVLVLTGLFAACGASAASQTDGGEADPAAAERGTTSVGEAVTEADRPATDEEPSDAREAAQERRPGVAVFPFVNGGSYGEGAQEMEAFRGGLQQFLLTQLAENDQLRIVERSALDRILQEQDLAETGRVDPSTAARVGELVGARYMISGVFADLYGEFRMDARIIDAETSEIVETASVTDDRENLYGLIVELAEEITRKADLPPLPPAAREVQREREIPGEAMTLYSRAQYYEREGRTDEAREIYERVMDRFPRVVEEYPEYVGAEQALRQLSGGTD